MLLDVDIDVAGAQVVIDELVHAQGDDVAIFQTILFHLAIADENTVRAVQVFDDAAVLVTDQLGVMPADELALDVDFIIR